MSSVVHIQEMHNLDPSYRMTVQTEVDSTPPEKLGHDHFHITPRLLITVT